MLNIFTKNKRNKQIKTIFKNLSNWKYRAKNNNGIVYFEITFKTILDNSIDKEKLRKRVSELPFKPASEVIEINGYTKFFGIYQ